MKEQNPFRERTAACLVLAALLLAAGGWINRSLFGDPFSPMSEGAFYINKVHAPAGYDLVMCGNSRVLQALSPAAMNGPLPGLRILNLGLDGACLTPQLLAFTEGRLDPEARRPAILLGIEPGTMERYSSANFKLNIELNRSGEKRFLARHLDNVTRWFEPVRPLDVTRLIMLTAKGPSPGRPLVYHEYHPDGWKATRVQPLPDFPAREEDLPPDILAYRPERVEPLPFRESLLSQVREWSRRGITVFGTRMPADARSRLKEDRLFDFSEDRMARDFEAAGGIWLRMDPALYRTFDGSHLHRDEAVRYSQDLAQSVREMLRTQNPPTER